MANERKTGIAKAPPPDEKREQESLPPRGERKGATKARPSGGRRPPHA